MVLQVPFAPSTHHFSTSSIAVRCSLRRQPPSISQTFLCDPRQAHGTPGSFPRFYSFPLYLVPFPFLAGTSASSPYSPPRFFFLFKPSIPTPSSTLSLWRFSCTSPRVANFRLGETRPRFPYCRPPLHLSPPLFVFLLPAGISCGAALLWLPSILPWSRRILAPDPEAQARRGTQRRQQKGDRGKKKRRNGRDWTDGTLEILGHPIGDLYYVWVQWQWLK